MESSKIEVMEHEKEIVAIEDAFKFVSSVPPLWEEGTSVLHLSVLMVKNLRTSIEEY